MVQVELLCTLAAVITSSIADNGEGFNFKIFESIEKDFVKINPVFAAMFFCPIDFTKQALKYNS